MPYELMAELESEPELGSTSESEQMYLITVARAEEAGNEGPVAIAKIADALGVSVPSANEMIRKLDTRGLLVYEPYRGVLLSKTGSQVADQVLRTRRLWATFLAEHLGFSPAAADDQACHLEHSTSAEAANRLAAYLGNPTVGPLGKRIPSGDTPEPRRTTVPLTETPVGAQVEVVAVSATGRSLQFLNAEGIAAGTRLSVVASGDSGILLETHRGEVFVDERLAAQVEIVAGGSDASA